MTDQEYEELKQRLCEDLGVKVVYVGNKEYERDYFKTAIKYYRDNKERFNYRVHSPASMWMHTKSLVFQYYGVHDLRQMMPEWKEEANKRAIDIMKLVEKEE